MKPGFRRVGFWLFLLAFLSFLLIAGVTITVNALSLPAKDGQFLFMMFTFFMIVGITAIAFGFRVLYTSETKMQRPQQIYVRLRRKNGND